MPGTLVGAEERVASSAEFLTHGTCNSLSIRIYTWEQQKSNRCCLRQGERDVSLKSPVTIESRWDCIWSSVGKQEMVSPQLGVPLTGQPWVLGPSLNTDYREKERLHLRSSGDLGSTLVLGIRSAPPNGYSKAGSGCLMGKNGGGAVSSHYTILRRRNKLWKP